MTRRRSAVLAAIVGVTAGLHACCTLPFPGADRKPPAVLALARPEAVGDLYRQWQREHERDGNGLQLRIALQFAKGLSFQPTRAR